MHVCSLVDALWVMSRPSGILTCWSLCQLCVQLGDTGRVQGVDPDALLKKTRCLSVGTNVMLSETDTSNEVAKYTVCV